MKTMQYMTNGTSALKVQSTSAKLTLVENPDVLAKTQQPDIIEQVFGYVHDRSCTSKVIAALQGTASFEFISGIANKRFALMASALACAALFAFSFINF